MWYAFSGCASTYLVHYSFPFFYIKRIIFIFVVVFVVNISCNNTNPRIRSHLCLWEMEVGLYVLPFYKWLCWYIWEHHRITGNGRTATWQVWPVLEQLQNKIYCTDSVGHNDKFFLWKMCLTEPLLLTFQVIPITASEKSSRSVLTSSTKQSFWEDSSSFPYFAEDVFG